MLAIIDWTVQEAISFVILVLVLWRYVDSIAAIGDDLLLGIYERFKRRDDGES